MRSKSVVPHPAIFDEKFSLPAVNIAWVICLHIDVSENFHERKRIAFLLIVSSGNWRIFGRKMLRSVSMRIGANLFFFFSYRTSAVFLLQRVWQGKGALAAILIPMLWYLLIRLRKEGENTYVYVELFVTILAACLTSSMALFLCPVLMGAFGLEYLISERRWSVVGRLILCTLPCIVLAIAEVILLYVL